MQKNKMNIKELIQMNQMFKHNDYRRLMQVRILEGLEDSSQMVIEGKAITFDDATVLFVHEGTEYKEIISRGALDNADLSYAYLKYNHSSNIMAMARTKNNTLQIEVRNDGVWIKAILANTTAGRDLYELVRSGIIDKMSFAFTIKDETYDKATHTWTVRKIDKLYDVAAVEIPAYENTLLFARRLGDAEACCKSEVEASRLERVLKIDSIRQRILVQIKNKEKKINE